MTIPCNGLPRYRCRILVRGQCGEIDWPYTPISFFIVSMTATRTNRLRSLLTEAMPKWANLELHIATLAFVMSTRCSLPTSSSLLCRWLFSQRDERSRSFALTVQRSTYLRELCRAVFLQHRRRSNIDKIDFTSRWYARKSMMTTASMSSKSRRCQH